MMIRDKFDKLYLIWNNGEGKEIEVGELKKKKNHYYFKYNIEGVKEAQEYGFELLPSLSKLQVSYFREGLFRAFTDWIPNKSKGLGTISKENNQEEIDEFEILRISKDNLNVDRFKFIEEEPFKEVQ